MNCSGIVSKAEARRITMARGRPVRHSLYINLITSLNTDPVIHTCKAAVHDTCLYISLLFYYVCSQFLLRISVSKYHIQLHVKARPMQNQKCQICSRLSVSVNYRLTYRFITRFSTAIKPVNIITIIVLVYILSPTRWAGQSPTWGRPAPQFRAQNQFK